VKGVCRDSDSALFADRLAQGIKNGPHPSIDTAKGHEARVDDDPHPCREAEKGEVLVEERAIGAR